MRNYGRYGNFSYTALIFCSVAQIVMSILYALHSDGDASQVILGWVTMGWSLITLAWVTILLVFFNRPRSTSFLSQVMLHYMSLFFLSGTWADIALAVLLYTNIGHTCSARRNNDTLGCGFLVTASVLATILCAQPLSFGSRTFVRGRRLGISNNIALLR
ncbi:unnamed protein product [Somion occarium]|uniref:MARVEL domain-containing protein n=1 Tax=Somion occarium TaxID=3059160 RepID=A0ABP1DHH1_9APHY